MSRPDLDVLVKELVPFAQHMLAKHGGFPPFGGFIGTAGEFKALAPYADPDVVLDAKVLIPLQARLEQMAHVAIIRAAAICLDVHFQVPGSDRETTAIQVRFENRDGEACSVLVPYRRGWFGRLRYGEPLTMPAKPTLFPR